MKDVLDILDARLKNLLDSLEKNRLQENCEYVIESAQINSQFIDVLQEILKIIEMASREHTPQTAVFFVRELSEGLGLEAQFLLNPLPTLNFTYLNITDYVDGILRHIAEAQKLPHKADVVVLSFPQTHKSDAILQTLFAHEIGHWLNDEKAIVERVFSLVLAQGIISREDLNAILEEFKQQFRAEMLTEPELEALIYDRIVKQTKNWLTETVSDLVGIRLLGPAFLFSLLNFLVRINNPDACSSEYPSARMRTRVLLQELENFGYHETFKELTAPGPMSESASEFYHAYGTIRDYILQAKLLTPPRSRLDEIVLRVLEKYLPEMKKEVSAAMGSIGYSNMDFRTDIPPLIDALRVLVPPCETRIGEPAKIASVVNSGLFFLETSEVEKLLKLIDDPDILSVRSKVNALTFKAIELSTIEKSWKRAA